MRILLALFILLQPTLALAVDYTSDVNCQGAFLMEDDGNETDVAQGNTLTETGGDIPQSATKKFGTYSRDFERGDGEYLTHADGLSTDINGADQAISIVAFIKIETATINSYVVAKYLTTGNQRQYAFYYRDDASAMRFILSPNGTNFSSATGATNTDDGAWHGIAAVYNDIDMRIYIGGSLDSNGANNPLTYSSGIADKSDIFRVGGFADLTSMFDGLIDDVAIFNRALTSVEVSDINTNGLVGSGEPPAVDNSQVIMIM